jgi:Alpha-mannosidase
VVVEVVKKAEDGADLIIRLYECYNRHTDTALRFAFDFYGADDCDLMENGVVVLRTEGREIPFTIKPYEIKTIRVRLSPDCSL